VTTRRTNGRQDGVTLMEIMVVLLILGLLASAMTIGYGRLPSTALRREGLRVAGALRSAYDGAAASGALHRVLLDLDDGTFRVERCEGKIELRRSRDLKEEVEREKFEAEKAQLVAQVQTPDVMLQGMLAGAGQSVGGAGGASGAKCTPMRGDMGKLQTLAGHPKVSFASVWVAHIEEPTEHGKLTINFFPLGTAEKAVVQLATDPENVFSIAVHPLTGRIDLAQGALKRPEDFMTTDATGARTP
jgi:prepilin-type N-terminal cleavage/methylation domain-containing protein